MRTKEEVQTFLRNLQWKRTTKKELEKNLQCFFNTDNKMEDSTDDECRNVDFSFVFTNGDTWQSEHMIDVEIWYLKMRKRNNILITGTEILTYSA